MRHITLLVLSICFVRVCSAQVVETQDGKIEFLGLDQWNVQMIQDSMAALNPDQPWHACGDVLKNDLGFPDASVLIFREDDGTLYQVVTVVEPQHSQRVVYKTEEFPGYGGEISAWKKAIDIFQKDDDTFSFGAALEAYPLLVKGQRDRALETISQWGADYAQVEQVWAVLEAHRSASDREEALWTLQNDGNDINRTMAAALLVNFPDSDRAWWALMDAQRDPQLEVSSMARTVLYSLFKREWLRDVDWRPVVNSIRHILNGTNLFALYATMDILVQTHVSPELAGILLKDGGDLVLAYLNAEHEQHKKLAHALLAQLSKEDYGYDVAQWTRWINSKHDDA